MLLGCGKSRIKRLTNPNPPANEHTSWNAVTVEDKANFVAFFENLDTEAGFACAHRLPLEYTTEPGLNSTILFERYKKESETSVPKKRFCQSLDGASIVEFFTLD